MKFYTEEGNWDLVGNNTPIFFIRDPLHVSGIVCVSDSVCACVRACVCACMHACVTEYMHILNTYVSYSSCMLILVFKFL